MADFIVALKNLMATCVFGKFIEESLRNRLIAGLQADAVRCRLLAPPDAELTWERACTVAVALEFATKDTQQMASMTREGIAASVSDLHWQGQAKRWRPQANAGKNAKSSMFAKAEKTMQHGTKVCHRYAGQHLPVSCRFVNCTCYKCQKKGQIAKMCKTKVVEQLHCDAAENELLTLCHTDQNSGTPAITVMLEVNGKKVCMEFDRGAAVSVMPESECAWLFPSACFREANVNLIAYNGTPVEIKGTTDVNVRCYEHRYSLPLVIAKDAGRARIPTLRCRNRLNKNKIRWHEVTHIQHVPNSVTVTETYSEVFEPGYGSMKSFKASVKLKEGVTSFL